MMKHVVPGFFAFLIVMAATTHAANKVVVVPLNSGAGNDRVWGEGRPGTDLLPHTPATGYCTSPSGVKLALSKNLTTWGSASSVCPANTWVCRAEDMPTSGSCPVDSAYTHSYVQCSGLKVPNPAETQTILTGWIADASDTFFGRIRTTGNFASINGSNDMCISYHVWCCWR